MIGIIFNRGNEVIEVRVDGNNLYFRSSEYGSQFATIDNLKLNKSGVLKEHPDLEDNDDWKNIAIERLREKVASLKTEDEKKDYVIKELSSVGYKPYAIQKEGHRARRL